MAFNRKLDITEEIIYELGYKSREMSHDGSIER